ncbi:hypothetical protein [Vibrio spartinae]|uniref:Glycosyl transferase family 2 n=1 Tax=Vibrio spartinae TaxID=1918945 RepID=A0A1N6M8H5_9VIBR|nr:hypothetical protein [Vibrio spartinae]SIO95745.1 hypothetical protein VSP9026_03497 [Vibrio spartinae]
MMKIFDIIQSQISKCYTRGNDWNISNSKDTYFYFNNENYYEVELDEYIQLSYIKDVDSVILLPTLWERCDKYEILEAIQRGIEQCLKFNSILMVSIQSGSNYRLDIIDSVQKLLSENKIYNKLILFLTDVRSKAYSINQTVLLARKINCSAVGWMDDDVILSDDAFLHLYEDLCHRNFIGSSGALKFPTPKKYPTSKFLNFAKNKMSTKKTKYPHGCCMMVGLSSIKNLIPARYICDDGFFFFELLDMRLDNPQNNMKIVEQSTCQHYVGGNIKDTYFRIRRSIISTLIYCADYSSDKSLYYLKEIQFKGLFPNMLIKSSVKDKIIKSILKFIFLIWHIIILIELFFRRVSGNPLREIAWSAYSWEKTESLKKKSSLFD